MVNESLELLALLLDSLDHERRHHEGPAESNPEVLMLRARDLRESRNL
jgi:hypothetical protein